MALDDLGGEKHTLAGFEFQDTDRGNTVFDEQTLVHRTVLFYFIVILCVIFFTGAGIFIFEAKFLRSMIKVTPLVIGLAGGLCLIPTVLLWVMVRAVFKGQQGSEIPDAPTADKCLDLLNKFSGKNP